MTANHPAPDNQIQREQPIQSCRPTDCQLDELFLRQGSLGSEQRSRAADIERLALSHVRRDVSFPEHLITNFSLDWQPG